MAAPVKASPDEPDPEPAPEPEPEPAPTAVSPGAAGEMGEPVAAGPDPDPPPDPDADPPDGTATFVPVALGFKAVTNPEEPVTEATLLREFSRKKTHGAGITYAWVEVLVHEHSVSK